MGNIFGTIIIILFILMSTIIIIEGNKKRKRWHKFKLNAQYQIDNFKIITHMATINVPGDKNSVEGKLVPTLGGNPVDISALQPDTDSYLSSDEGIATVTKESNGVFKINRVSPNGGSTLISYSATATTGGHLSGSDSFIFDAVPPPPPSADGLTASYSDPI